MLFTRVGTDLRRLQPLINCTWHLKRMRWRERSSEEPRQPRRRRPCVPHKNSSYEHLRLQVQQAGPALVAVVPRDLVPAVHTTACRDRSLHEKPADAREDKARPLGMLMLHRVHATCSRNTPSHRPAAERHRQSLISSRAFLGGFFTISHTVPSNGCAVMPCASACTHALATPT